jgi:diadenosine tetraphosphate (Ap4A) HIT family hydrolase
VVHTPDPVVLAGKLFVTLERHAESLSELTADEAAELAPLLPAVVGALEDELAPERVHVGSYGEELAHVHLHVTPRTRRLPRGNVPASLTQDALALLVRLRVRRAAPPAEVDALAERLRDRVETRRSP